MTKSHKSYTDRLFEEDTEFFITTEKAAIECLQKIFLYRNNGESYTRWERHYLLEIVSPKGIRTVSRALEILGETAKGYNVRTVTDYNELRRIERDYMVFGPRFIAKKPKPLKKKKKFLSKKIIVPKSINITKFL